MSKGNAWDWFMMVKVTKYGTTSVWYDQILMSHDGYDDLFAWHCTSIQFFNFHWGEVFTTFFFPLKMTKGGSTLVESKFRSKFLVSKPQFKSLSVQSKSESNRHYLYHGHCKSQLSQRSMFSSKNIHVVPTKKMNISCRWRHLFDHSILIQDRKESPSQKAWK